MRARLKFKFFVVIISLLFLAVFLPILGSGGLASAQKETDSTYSIKNLSEKLLRQRKNYLKRMG